MSESGVVMPKHGFQVRLDHKFPERWRPATLPRWHQLRHFIMLTIRYIVWFIGSWLAGQRPFINQLQPVTSRQGYGVPLGGIGGGTVGRTVYGDFCRFQLRPGHYEYAEAVGDQFIATVRDSSGALLRHQVLNPRAAASEAGGCGGGGGGRLSRWRWRMDGAAGSYCGLYPRAWWHYQLAGQDAGAGEEAGEKAVSVSVRQVSPVIPHNYRDSCLPCAVFVCSVTNTEQQEARDVAVTFTFENFTGDASTGVVSSEPVTLSTAGACSALAMYSADDTHCDVTDRKCFVVAVTSQDESARVSGCSFDAAGDGGDIWDQLATSGTLTYSHQSPAKSMGVAVSGRLPRLLAGQCKHIIFTLVWCQPQIRFRRSAHIYHRYYTRWHGVDMKAGARSIAEYALANWDRWERDIDAWQQPILSDSQLPDWYKSALFNELYFISDGGSVWLEHPQKDQLADDDPRREFGRFAYLESHEYIMYNTYDVHFYASQALVHLWPQLQLALQQDMAEFIGQTDTEQRTALYTGQLFQRKVAATVPHDVGNPDEAPFEKLNSYQIHDIAQWKDLNLKFVLQVYRDYGVTGDLSHVTRMWPVCVSVMRYVCCHFLTANKDDINDDSGGGEGGGGGDGDIGGAMIHNSAAPDQTYDSWTMTGVSAYCGGLWIASLHAMCDLSRRLKDADTLAQFAPLLPRALAVYEKHLWTGSYYRFDSSGTSNGQCIMSDQLCGHWYLRSSGHHTPVFKHVPTALATIYAANVCRFGGGRCGAVNGMFVDGTVNTHTVQSEEMWTGVTYALAATMIYEGMIEQGFSTAEGVYRTVYERIGLGFDTPEALYEQGRYRAVGYMRPLSIWSMQVAWQSRNEQKSDR